MLFDALFVTKLLNGRLRFTTFDFSLDQNLSSKLKSIPNFHTKNILNNPQFKSEKYRYQHLIIGRRELIDKVNIAEVPVYVKLIPISEVQILNLD